MGNDGPASPPLFPAAYDGVIGVTGVDSKHRVLIEACRGKQVDFAALGSEVSAAAAAPDQYAPACAALRSPRRWSAAFFVDMRVPHPAARDSVIGRLAGLTQDLGKPGRDDIYGVGELGLQIAKCGANK